MIYLRATEQQQLYCFNYCYSFMKACSTQFSIVAIFLSFLFNLYAGSTFTCYQVTLWQGSSSPKTQSTPIYQYNHSYSYPYNSTYSRALALSGVYFHLSNTMDFKANIIYTSETYDTIEFTINRNMTVYFASFGLVLIRSDRTWIWTQSQWQEPSLLSIYGHSNMTQVLRAIPLIRTLAVPGDYNAYVFIKYLNSTAQYNSNISPQATLEPWHKNETHIWVQASRSDNNQQIHNVSFIIMIYNWVLASTNPDVTVLSYTFNVYLAQTTWVNSYAARPTNFGIIDKFRTDRGFDGNCLAGMKSLKLGSSQTSYVYINMTTYPIDASQRLDRDVPGTMYQIRVDNFFFCVSMILRDTDCSTLLGLPAQCTKCVRGICLQCQNGMVVDSQNVQRCVCQLGQLINGVCSTIAGCVDPILTTPGIQICLSCDTTYYHQLPVNNKCVCQTGTEINGVCNTVSGCAVPELQYDGTIVCISCNVSANFDSTPTPSGQCVCKQYYELNKQVCQEVCGNGKIFSSSIGVCDDGNTVNGDGCSDTCQVEKFYSCDNSQSPSVCIYKGNPLSLTLDSIRKNGDQNQGIFVFNLQPQLNFLHEVQVAATVTLSCESEYTVSQTSYSGGQLTLVVDYTQDMESVPCNLTIVYDPSVASLDNSILSFDAISDNQKLIIVNMSNLQTKQKITFIFKLLSYAALTVFFVSLRHKMIGLQLISMCQVIYFSYAFYTTQSFVSSSIIYLKFVTGYRTLFYKQTDGKIFYPFCQITQMSRQVLQNSNVWLVILSLIILLTLLVFLKEYCTEKHTFLSEQQSLIKHCLQANSVQYMYNCLIFPLIFFNFTLNTVSININSAQVTRDHDTFSNQTNGLCILVMWIVSSLAFATEFILLDSKGRGVGICGTQQISYFYIPLFLSKLLLFSFLIVLGLWLKFDLIVIIITFLFFISITTLIICRPYTDSFSNLNIIICESISLYSLTLAAINDKIDMSQEAEIFLLLVLEGLITIAICLTAIRTFIYYRYLCLVNFDESRVLCQSNKNEVSDQESPIQNKVESQSKKSKEQFSKDVMSEYMLRYLKNSSKVDYFKQNDSVLHMIEQDLRQSEVVDSQELKQVKSRLRCNLLRKRKKVYLQSIKQENEQY